MQKSYDEGVTDEFIKPIVCVDGEDRPLGTIREGDVVIFFNFRNDRAKELTIALTQQDMPEFGMKRLPLYYCCMTPYDAKFEGLHILFDKENVVNTIGEYVSKQGLDVYKRQMHSRSKPMPVSTWRAGSGSSRPSALRLNCMNTRFHISITRWCPLLTSSRPSSPRRSSSLRRS